MNHSDQLTDKVHGFEQKNQSFDQTHEQKNNSHNLAKILTFRKRCEIKGRKIKKEREGDGT